MVTELLGLVEGALSVQAKPPMETSLVVTVDGEQKVAFAKSMTKAEVVAMERALIAALGKFIDLENPVG